MCDAGWNDSAMGNTAKLLDVAGVDEVAAAVLQLTDAEVPQPSYGDLSPGREGAHCLTARPIRGHEG